MGVFLLPGHRVFLLASAPPVRREGPLKGRLRELQALRDTRTRAEVPGTELTLQQKEEEPLEERDACRVKAVLSTN